MTQTIFPYSAQSPWYSTRDSDPSAMAIFSRHYTCRPERKLYQFVGPGEHMVLITRMANALFVWRKFLSDAGEHGINCSVFRNESGTLSSDLIRAACRHAWERWPGQRLYTYVGAAQTASRRGKDSLPGQCFIHAGWTLLREADGSIKRTKRRKHCILELLPTASYTTRRLTRELLAR